MQAPITHDDLTQMIVQATTDVSSTMLSLELTAGDAYTNQNDPGPTNGVVSLIGLAGAWVGTGSVACSSAFACLLSSQLLMAECEVVDEDVLDAVAEITNMIIGNVKTLLEERLGPLGLSIPTVVFGHNFTTRSIGKSAWTVVPFQHGEHKLEVQLNLAPNQDGRSKVRHGFSAPPQSVQA
jgi:chemotaxis protein CheX